MEELGRDLQSIPGMVEPPSCNSTMKVEELIVLHLKEDDRILQICCLQTRSSRRKTATKPDVVKEPSEITIDSDSQENKLVISEEVSQCVTHRYARGYVTFLKWRYRETTRHRTENQLFWPKKTKL